MDRLPPLTRVVLTLWAVAWLGCDEPAAAPPPSRVVAVAAKAQEHDLAHLCDVRPEKDAAPVFASPELEGEPPAPSGGVRWVNVWASWCKPCIEELPSIARTLKSLEAGGTPVQFVPISADADAEALEAFQRRFEVLAGSTRFADASQMAEWAAQMGLDAGATLPLHFFLDAAGRVRCARAGAVSEADMALVEDLVATMR